MVVFHRLLIILFFQLVSSFYSFSAFSFQSHWEDDFSLKEKEHLQKWIQHVGNAVESTLGKYPFNVQVYFHRSRATNEPVPWAHTSRTNEEAVHFHVNPSFSFQELISDWTAAHEIAHLSIPYIGQENSWFSEGYASYFQWQIMFNQGVLTKDELIQKYTQRLASALPKFQSDLSFIDIVKQLQKRHDYPTYYYGGACYFIQVDQQLKKINSSGLAGIIQKFQVNGRLETTNLNSLIIQLNKLSESTVFSELFDSFHNDPARESVGKTKYQ